MSQPRQNNSQEELMKEPKEGDLIKIGDLAKKIGVTTRTLRYYEEIRLVPPAHRLEGGARAYDKNQVKRLRFILKLKEFGVSLKEMHELSDLYEIKQTPEDVLPRTLEMLDQHITAMEAKINSITELKSQILEFRGHIVNRMEEKEKKQDAK